jgi:hypothetical protein
MIPNAILILKTQLNQDVFLPLCSEILGRSPARTADTDGLVDIRHLISTISNFSETPETDSYDLLQFGFLIVADERDLAEILEVASGMAFALTETIIRGIQAVIITGSLRQWTQAVARGCRKNQSTSIRACYDKIYLDFCQLGLSSIFCATKRDLPDHTFYLTYDKRI